MALLPTQASSHLTHRPTTCSSTSTGQDRASTLTATGLCAPDRQTDRQAERQADREAGRQAGTQTDRQPDGQVDKQTSDRRRAITHAGLLHACSALARRPPTLLGSTPFARRDARGNRGDCCAPRHAPRPAVSLHHSAPPLYAHTQLGPANGVVRASARATLHPHCTLHQVRTARRHRLSRGGLHVRVRH